jgi:hypothetical protein
MFFVECVLDSRAYRLMSVIGILLGYHCIAMNIQGHRTVIQKYRIVVQERCIVIRAHGMVVHQQLRLEGELLAIAQQN